ncbi:MAG: trigger factor [Lachnospiraceae bacterium]|nr:trigger factor [Lachnospiraceae bacterium]
MKKRVCVAVLAGAALMAAVPVCAQEAQSEAVTEAVTEAAGDAAEEETPAVRPEYKALDYVKLGEYMNLPVEIDPIVVLEEEIRTAVINAAKATEGVEFEELTEGEVADGDIANIDYEGKKDGVAFEGGTAEGYDLTIGSGTFIAGFESGLVGAKIGETVDLNLTFPENYGSAELAGADVVFTVKVNSVKRVPELSDSLVNTLSGGLYSTVDGYMSYLTEQLRAQKEAAQESAIDEELMTQLHNTCEITDYPQDLLDYSVNSAMEYYTNVAESYDMTLEDLVSGAFGQDMEGFAAAIEEDTKASLQQELLLRAIAEQENLEVTDEIYQMGCEKYAALMGYDSIDAFKEVYTDQVIRTSLLMDLALDLVRDNALIIEKELETEAEVQPEEAVTEAVTEG